MGMGPVDVQPYFDNDRMAWQVIIGLELDVNVMIGMISSLIWEGTDCSGAGKTGQMVLVIVFD